MGCGTEQEVTGTVIWSVRWQASGLDFSEHLLEVMIHFWDGGCDGRVGTSTDIDATVRHERCRQLWSQHLDHLVIS